MKKLNGLQIAQVTDLENGMVIELSDGTQLVGNIFVLEGSGKTAEDTSAPEKPKEVEKKPNIPTYEELEDMDLDDLKDLIDDHDLDIKTKGKDEDDLIPLIAEELGIKKPSKKEEKKAPKKSEVDVDDLEWADIDGMDEDELEDLIKQEKMDIDTEDYDDDLAGLKKAVAKELGIKPPKK